MPKIDKEEVNQVLDRLSASLAEAVEVSSCDFDIVHETRDVPSELGGKTEPTGWTRLTMKIRWRQDGP